MVEVQPQILDRISTLPQDTIEKILTLIPIEDALRTSILSKKWRHCWKGMHKLVFDDKYMNMSSNSKQIKKYKFVNAIFHVLLLHNGPISEFGISINTNKKIYDEIDQIIVHLSKSKKINKFIFKSWSNDVIELYYFKRYKLPSVFFSFQGLEHLHLTYCVIELPLTSDGFIMLTSLRLCSVNITKNTLLQLLTNCPLLLKFILMGCQNDSTTQGDKCTFLELSERLPLVQVLKISKHYMEQPDAAVGMEKLPNSLVHLRILVLDVCFLEQNGLSYALSVVSSSPNLEKIKIELGLNGQPWVGQTCKDLLDLQDYSGRHLDHLKELEMTSFHYCPPEMAFVKFIMAKSPVLQKARIELYTTVSVDEENKMLRDLLRLTFPRASPAVDIIIER